MANIIKRIDEDTIEITKTVVETVSISSLEAELAKWRAEVDMLEHRDDLTRARAAVANLETEIASHRGLEVGETKPL